ncbi:MAG TPA: protein kinase [Polyangiaceae bacterium]|nr:protein kinase [Polyangiaceae bacterium]
MQRLARLLEPDIETGPGRAALKAGDVLAERYIVERLAGEGGMGAVYRGTDRLVGVAVAIKVMGRAVSASGDRFRDEVRFLSRLQHPAIVRYIAHGAATDGAAFLVMEWLEGEDLAQHLAKKKLDLGKSLLLACRAAEGLAVAHAEGIIHRDIKPSNLFLVGGDPGQLKVLDFGIARENTRARVITRTGAVLGTVGYMAPEQARGTVNVDVRADVFSLGCVLFECLTGRPAFASEHDVAVLAKILLEEAPRVRDLAPDTPPALDDLVSRMLTKDPSGRPANALAVLAEMEDLRSSAIPVLSTPSAPRPEVLTRVEQRYMSVMLLEPGLKAPAADATLATVNVTDRLTKLRAVVERFGGDIAMLGGGMVLVTRREDRQAADGAAQAASCALRLRDTLAVRSVVLATGRAESIGAIPAGPVIDRAASLLRSLSSDEGGIGVIVVDEVTAGLLDARFDVVQEAARYLLVHEHVDSEWPRTVLGRRTPCVGREKELGALEAVVAECFSSSAAYSVLVSGPPGIGKSRVRREFTARVRRETGANILLARADPVSARSPLTLARQLVRSAMHLQEGDSVASQHATIMHHLAKRLSGIDLLRVSDFLAELVEAPSPNDPSLELRAARDDSRIMNEWMARTFEEWLAAECSQRPLLLVLEDIQWGDLPSLNYIERAFRRLLESPLMLVAFARPEVHDTFPKLRASFVRQEIHLDGLARRPVERLVRSVLGERATEPTVARIVDQCGGNAFFIEELIRTVAQNGSEKLPDTVLAMASARLHALEPDARLILRGASIFGNVFWEGGVTALVRGFGPSLDVHAWLQLLVEREVLTPERSNRFPGETAFAFRHGLLREAAYAMLTDTDRGRGHFLAAEWLLRVGEKDALLLADHYELGGRLELAMPWLLRAAEVALNGADHQVAAEIAERGLKSATGETLGTFLEIQQLARAFRGDWSGAFQVGAKASALLRAGSTRWFRSAGSAMLAGIYLGKPETTLEVLRTSAALPTPEPSGPFGLAMYMLIGTLLHAGAREIVLQVIDRLETVAKSQTDHDLAFAGWLRTARCTARMFLFDEVGSAVKCAREALQCFDRAADFVGWAVAALYCGIAHIEAGQAAQARPFLEDVMAESNHALQPTRDFARYYLARANALEGDTTLAEKLLDAPPGLADGARGFMAEAHLRAGRFDLAGTEAQRIEHSASIYARVTALAVRARISLREGRIGEAKDMVERAIDEQDRGSAVPFWRSILLLTRVQAFEAAGEPDFAAKALVEAHDRVQRIAAGFDDPLMRDSYLRGVEANASIVAMAQAQLV